MTLAVPLFILVKSALGQNDFKILRVFNWLIISSICCDYWYFIGINSAFYFKRNPVVV